MTPKLLSNSTIKGSKVRNKNGENIGNIEDLMVDWQNGQVGYAVLSFGGIMGLGDKLFAIPLKAFQFNFEDKDADIILNVDKEKLKNAPGFDKNNWPQYPDESFVGSVYTHFGVEPYWERFERAGI